MYLIIALFALVSLLYASYAWQVYMATSLSPAERRLLMENDPLVIAGDAHFPPLSFTKAGGQHRGYEADLVVAMAQWLNITLEYRQLPWHEAVNALSSGEVTAISGMRITEERLLSYHFTEPYWQSAYCFVNYIGRDHELILAGRRPRVTMQEQSATYNYFMDNLFEEQMALNLVPDPQEGFQLLRQGYTDIWFENYQVALYEVLSADMIDYFRFHILPESQGDYAMALGPEHEALVPLFNKALSALEADGTLAALDRTWLGLTDYRSEAASTDFSLWTGLYILFSLFVLIISWNRSLHLRVNKKTEELRKSEEKFRASFEGAHDAIIIMDQAGTFLDCNTNALKLFCFESKEELLKTEQAELFPPRQDDGQESLTTYRMQADQVLRENSILRFQWVHRRRNGDPFPSEISLSTYTVGGKQILQASISDITERKQMEDQLRYLSLHDQLTGLYNRTYFEAELARFENSRFYPITLVTCDLDGLKIINDSMGHETGDRLLISCARLLESVLRSSDILTRVGGDEFCAILPHTGQEEGESVARRIRSAVNDYNEGNEELPLGISVGLATAEKAGHGLKELFRSADDMMYRDKLYRSRSVHNKVVESLMAALAERDYITEGHAQRLETLCCAMGDIMQLSSSQLADLALLTKVHDLGKVGIPDRILNKPGALDSEEWAVMKQHPEKGFRIARASPDLSGVAELILKHHERWDGRGYPLGLRGEEIPAECRILAVVDAYDAMTNDRPYAKARSREEALEEITASAGSQFDPHAVEVFLEVVRPRDAR